MNVQNNSSSMNALYQMQLAKKKQEEEAEKLASGFKINDAGDNAAGLAISEKMRADITIATQAQKNTADATNMVKTAEGALQGINTMLNRATELSAQASNGTYTDVERAAIQSEMDAIASEVNRVAASTNFNGINLLDGSVSASSGESIDLQVGTDGSVSSSIDLNIENVAMSQRFDASQMSVMSVEDAAAVLDQLKEFVTSITTERADLGAKQNRLEHTDQALSFTIENLQRAESEIRDTDMAKTASEESQSKLQLNYALANVKNSEEQKKGVLNLLA